MNHALPASLRSPRRSLRERLSAHVRARLRRRALERRIAGGADPQSDAALALVAERLTAQRVRSHTAESLRRVIEEAEAPPLRAYLSSRAPLQRREIAAARRDLVWVAARLESSGTVGAQGVAMARELLTDAASPLYTYDSDGGRLSSWAEATLDALARSEAGAHEGRWG